MEDDIHPRCEAMESDCEVHSAGEDNYLATSLSSLGRTASLDCTELFCNDESFSPAAYLGRSDQVVQESAPWASASAGVGSAQPAVSPMTSDESILEMIRQELAAEQDAVNEASCCAAVAASGTGVCPPAVWTEHRRVLCEWMLALCRAASMTRETFCLAASLLDRYVAESCAAMGDKGYPSEGTLQLLAMACLSLAMKYEEVAPLHSTDLLRLALDPHTGALMYTAADLGRMEWLVLEMLSWRVRVPTPTSFLTLLLPACGATSAVASSLSELPRDDSAHSAAEPLVQRASRLLDMCVLRAPQLPYQPSIIAMTCLLMAERLSGATAVESQRILQLWRDLFPHAQQQQQQQQQQLQHCYATMEALWCAAHGDGMHLLLAQQQPYEAPAAASQTWSCAAAVSSPATTRCAALPAASCATGRGLHQRHEYQPSSQKPFAPEDHVSLVQRQYMAWVQEYMPFPAEAVTAVMPHSCSTPAVLSW